MFLMSLLIWPHWVFVAAQLAPVVVSGGCSLVVVHGCLIARASLVAETGSRHLGRCGAWAQLPLGMWDLPGPGTEPMPPALAHGFLTTGPPEKSSKVFNY